MTIYRRNKRSKPKSKIKVKLKNNDQSKWLAIGVLCYTKMSLNNVKKRTKTLQTGLNVWQEWGMKGKTVNLGKPVTSVLLRIL